MLTHFEHAAFGGRDYNSRNDKARRFQEGFSLVLTARLSGVVN
jgi:hypothetical protein